MFVKISKELKNHAPFTFMGAFTGIIIFFLLKNAPEKLTFTLFYTFHPLHVFLSAFVTASIYKLNSKEGNNFIKLFLIGYFGSIGIATLSDCIIPFLGETLLNLPNRGIHLGFIEKWYIVNPLAFLGIAFAWFIPSTKFPHFGHVLVSTWASLFHVMLAMDKTAGTLTYILVLLLLFISVWVPCCVSDIVFPLLFVSDDEKIS